MKPTQTISLRPIAHIRTPYREKFATPRQPGLVQAASGRVIFTREFRNLGSLEGLGGFSHIWLTFHFHLIGEKEPKLRVRPPRLGGNEKRGVWATRSPYRPNRLGLSLVRLLQIEEEAGEGPSLMVSSPDLVDGTPILDIKPYLPYAESLPEARAGYAPDAPPSLPVDISPEAQATFSKLRPELQDTICQTLSLDPRPAYHHNSDQRPGKNCANKRAYHTLVEDHTVTWKVANGTLIITHIQ